MTVFRRWLVLIAFAFWQGGFTFYTAAVVPIGTEVLGGPLEQGMITRRVTIWLNGAGAVALVFLVWDAYATRPQRRSRLFMCGLLAAGLLGLFVMHGRLDGLIDLELQRVHDRPLFRTWHRYYLWISTVQWAAGVVYLLLTTIAWRKADSHLSSSV